MTLYLGDPALTASEGIHVLHVIKGRLNLQEDAILRAAYIKLSQVAGQAAHAHPHEFQAVQDAVDMEKRFAN